MSRSRLSCLVLLATTSIAALAATAPVRADMAAAQTAIAHGDYAAAGTALAPLASGGDADAQYQWAALALDGHAVGLAPDRAVSLLVQSAAQGNAHAQARLGMEYARGDHVPLNNLAAYTWLSRASAAPSLSDNERQQVTALRQDLLDKIAPQTKYTPPAPGATASSGSNQKIPAAERAAAAPVSSVASVPLFSDPPLPTTADDSAANSAPAGSKAATDATDGGKAGGKADAAAKQSLDAQKPQKIASTSTSAGMTSSAATSSGSAGNAPQSLSTAAGKAYFVQMASLPNENAATAEAGRLAKKYADILRGVSVGVRRADLGTKGFTQRVLAGPFDSLNTAKERCLQLAAHNQDCRVIKIAN
jgi:hypothetical protein